MNFAPIKKPIRPEGKLPKKKLLFVINSLAGGGAEKILIRLLAALDPERYDVHLAMIESKADFFSELPHHVRLHPLHKASRWDFPRLIWRLRKVIKSERPDTVISLLEYANVLTGLAWRLSGSEARLLLCDHQFPCPEYATPTNRRFMPWLTRLVYPWAHRLIVVSLVLKNYWEKQLNLPPGRVKVIYNPIPLEAVREQSHENVQHPFFMGGQYRVLIHVGRLERVKRHDRLLRIFTLAHQLRPDLRLLILGKGSLEPELKALTRSLGVEKVVDFVGFQVNPYAWMAKADCFVLSSEYEGFPNVLIEAMACELPVVSVDCLSGPAEIIQDGQNGFLVPVHSDTCLAEAVLKLVGDPVLHTRFIKAGREFAERFATERIVPLYEQEF
jgi:glycosyltransferase involved in cell wall biosynthesis